jgi:hypothetical protein
MRRVAQTYFDDTTETLVIVNGMVPPNFRRRRGSRYTEESEDKPYGEGPTWS